MCPEFFLVFLYCRFPLASRLNSKTRVHILSRSCFIFVDNSLCKCCWTRHKLWTRFQKRPLDGLCIGCRCPSTCFDKHLVSSHRKHASHSSCGLLQWTRSITSLFVWKSSLAFRSSKKRHELNQLYIIVAHFHSQANLY